MLLRFVQDLDVGYHCGLVEGVASLTSYFSRRSPQTNHQGVGEAPLEMSSAFWSLFLGL